MFSTRTSAPAFIDKRAQFAQRKVALQAAAFVPAHVANEWTGSDRPAPAADRVRQILGY